jgi:hypothetical protein
MSVSEVTGERWFTNEELHEMSRPTMDRAIECLDRGDTAAARELCDAMRTEWRYLHDLMTKLILGLITAVQEAGGDAAVETAWETTMRVAWKDDVQAIFQRDRRRVVEALAASWRAHSGSGTGPSPGAFSIEEDAEKFTFRMNPCGSGQRLWRNGAYRGENAGGVTKAAHTWSYGREGFPLYCTHCSFMNDLLPIKWYGMPLYPSDPPDDFERDPCVWYWYKDPQATPERFWERYGLRTGPVAEPE